MKNGSNGRLKIAVIGAGRMGLNHLRIYSMLRGVDVVAVVDPIIERARSAADPLGAKACTSLSELPDDLDGASVVVPTSHHLEVSLPLLEAGVSCLVEKPLAVDETECLRLLEAARRSGAKLLVGHVERFNPAVETLSAILHSRQIRAIEARRMSSASARIHDVNVVFDLMIHDLDILASLIRRPVVDVSARGVMMDGQLAFVAALVSFESGVLANVVASRITQNKIREMMVTTEEGLYSVNYITHELLVHRQRGINALPSHRARQKSYILELATERVLVRPDEPLQVELIHFLDVVRGRVEPTVSGAAGYEAVRLAAAIDAAARNAA
jgi:predicted dehydrogenase